jgi:hypothetical protein
MAQDTGLDFQGTCDSDVAVLDKIVRTHAEACELELKARQWFEKYGFGTKSHDENKHGEGGVRFEGLVPEASR